MQRENKKMAIARSSFQGFPDFTVKLIPARANFDTFFKIHYFRWFFRRVQSIYINGSPNFRNSRTVNSNTKSPDLIKESNKNNGEIEY